MADHGCANRRGDCGRTFLLINLVTVTYFGPAVLRVEKVSPPPDDPVSLKWVRRSRGKNLIWLIVPREGLRD
jgi:hypothetical protein